MSHTANKIFYYITGFTGLTEPVNERPSIKAFQQHRRIQITHTTTPDNLVKHSQYTYNMKKKINLLEKTFMTNAKLGVCISAQMYL